MTQQIRILNQTFLDRLSAEAAATARRRKNFNLHEGDNAVCHRFFNALYAATYVQPHRHADPAKAESIVLLRGRMGVIEFDDQGEVIFSAAVKPGAVVDVPANTWHTWVALEDDTIFFEAKAGPYLPLTPAEKAPFAPPEGDPRAPEYLVRLKSLFTAIT